MPIRPLRPTVGDRVAEDAGNAARVGTVPAREGGCAATPGSDCPPTRCFCRVLSEHHQAGQRVRGAGGGEPTGRQRTSATPRRGPGPIGGGRPPYENPESRRAIQIGAALEGHGRPNMRASADPGARIQTILNGHRRWPELVITPADSEGLPRSCFRPARGVRGGAAPRRAGAVSGQGGSVD